MKPRPIYNDFSESELAGHASRGQYKVRGDAGPAWGRTSGCPRRSRIRSISDFFNIFAIFDQTCVWTHLCVWAQEIWFYFFSIFRRLLAWTHQALRGGAGFVIFGISKILSSTSWYRNIFGIFPNILFYLILASYFWKYLILKFKFYLN